MKRCFWEILIAVLRVWKSLQATFYIQNGTKEREDPIVSLYALLLCLSHACRILSKPEIRKPKRSHIHGFTHQTHRVVPGPAGCGHCVNFHPCFLCSLCSRTWEMSLASFSPLSHDSVPLVEFKHQAWAQDLGSSVPACTSSFVFLRMAFIVRDCTNQHIAECRLQGGIALWVGLIDSLGDAQPTFLSVNQFPLSFSLPCTLLSLYSYV